MAAREPYVARPDSRDTATQSNYEAIRTSHIHLDWSIDWQKKLVQGRVVHTLEAREDGVTEAVLDTSYLDLRHVSIGGHKASFQSKPRHAVLGNALHVALPKAMKRGETCKLEIEYSTTEKCTSLGWLDAHQTPSKTLPLLFSQSQAIHSRSLFPCFDTPAVKLSFSGVVRSSLPGVTVLLSGRRVSPPTDYVPDATSTKPIEWRYDQPTLIPCYLIAIAAGNLQFGSTGKRTGVWADPERLDACVHEFKEDSERFLDAAEEITGAPYDWGTWHSLVLPESFPYGGMENANCTFLTPTLIAGDRSLVDVVAHEMSHSWFGNHLSCASWSHFWLNEGWTTYLERLIIRKTKGGEPARGFSFIVGRTALEASFKEMPPAFRTLEIDYKFGDDPDDGFSTVPYDRGANFLLHLETTVGGLNNWLPYMRAYFKHFAGQSITTAQWRDHLFAWWQKHDPSKMEALNAVDWEGWLHGTEPSLPVENVYDTKLADKAFALADKLDAARQAGKLDDYSAADLEDFTSGQTVVFLEKLAAKRSFNEKSIEAVERAFSFDSTANTEIRLRWYIFALPAAPKYAKSAAEWVVTVGRLKFCRPVFRLLHAVDPLMAQSTYTKHKSFFHAIARGLIEKDIGIVPTGSRS